MLKLWLNLLHLLHHQHKSKLRRQIFQHRQELFLLLLLLRYLVYQYLQQQYVDRHLWILLELKKQALLRGLAAIFLQFAVRARILQGLGLLLFVLSVLVGLGGDLSGDVIFQETWHRYFLLVFFRVLNSGVVEALKKLGSLNNVQHGLIL